MTETTEKRWVHLDPRDLTSWRMEHGLTRRQLSMHFQVSTSQIRAFERGDAVPPEWMQDRMVSTILDGSPPEISVPRGRHRRYRWSKLSADALYRWRRNSGLTQAQAADLLGCSPSSISAWERNECAPDRDTQTKLRDTIQGYDDGSFPRPVPEPTPTRPSVPPHELPTGDSAMSQPSQTTNLTAATADDEVGSSRRAGSIMDRIDAVKMPEKLGEARWGRYDGFVVIRSNVTGAHYMIESVTGRFFRTHSPRSTKITSDSPKGVVAEDRAWLYPLLGQLPEGKIVLARYNRGEAPPEEKKVTPTPTPPPAAVHQLVDLAPVVETRRITMVEKTGKLPIRPDHLHAMLRATGVKDADKIPATAKISLDPETGNVVLSWDLGMDTVEE